jgi:hypothetical protein
LDLQTCASKWKTSHHLLAENDITQIDAIVAVKIASHCSECRSGHQAAHDNETSHPETNTPTKSNPAHR